MTTTDDREAIEFSGGESIRPIAGYIARSPAFRSATSVTDWSQVAATAHPGEKDQAFWRTLDIGDSRVRVVEYTAGYLAGH